MRITVGTTTKQEGSTDPATFVFVFEDDPEGRLDTWQRVNPSGEMTLAATSGEKKVAAISGASLSEENWYWIESYDNLLGRKVRLCEEYSYDMTRSGLAEVSGEMDKSCFIYMRPCSAKISLRSICVDFLGRPYEDSTIEDMKAYLTNVNGETHIFESGTDLPALYLNFSGLDTNDMERMKDPSIIFRNLPENIGVLPHNVDLDFYCYPNSIEEESFGRSFTRLVIEGKIGGRTFYWPINIIGIERDRCYCYDLAITRIGSDDPDIPVTQEEVRVNLAVEDWEMTDDKVERF